LLAKKLKLNTTYINKSSYKEVGFKAKRPKDMRMKIGLLNNMLKIKPVDLKEEITRVANEYK
jgi:dTDP-4-dehydrorhamnose reductase